MSIHFDRVQIVTGEAPVRGRMRDVRCPEDCPREVANLIDACMRFDPDSRPSAIEAFEILRRVMRCEQRNSCHSFPRTTKSIDIPRSTGTGLLKRNLQPRCCAAHLPGPVP